MGQNASTRTVATVAGVSAVWATQYFLAQSKQKKKSFPEELKETIGDWAVLGSLPGQKVYDGHAFPLVICPKDENISQSDTYSLISKNSEWFNNTLIKHGAILFRGFPLPGAEEFNDFVHSFNLQELPYIGGAAPRSTVTGAVFTTNESPPDMKIPFHHEMAQAVKYPHKVFFFCDVPPTKGGETPICPSHHVYLQVKEKYPDFIAKLVKDGCRYKRIMPSFDDKESPIGRGWKSTYLCETKEEAEKNLVAGGTEFKWLGGEEDQLETVTGVLDGIRADPRTGKKCWFNSLVAAYHGWTDTRNNGPDAIMFGDNTPMPGHVMEYAAKVQHGLKVSPQWLEKDVMMLDNRITMHSRAPFTPPRKIYASLWVDKSTSN